jgi:hypothetical protein
MILNIIRRFALIAVCNQPAFSSFCVVWLLVRLLSDQTLQKSQKAVSKLGSLMAKITEAQMSWR